MNGLSNLKSKAINGVLWTSIRTIFSALIAPLLLILKARFLSPGEFGVLAIISVQLTIINVLDNFGMSTAIIQRDKITKNERSSLFILEIGICVFITLLMILSAPIMANIFNMPTLSTLIPLLSISLVFSGSDNIFQSFLEKEFFFKELSVIHMVREGLLVTLTFVFLVLDMGLYGVVLAQVLSSVVNTIIIFIVAFKKDMLHLKFHFKYSEVHPFLKFGSFVVGKQIMTQLTHNVDELIIGYYFTPDVLGLYHFAKNLLNRIRVLLTTSFSKVLFPLLSAVKNDMKLLSNTYWKVSKFIGVFAFPFFVGLALTADLFIPAFFGEQWIDSVDFFIILSLAYIPYILTANLATSLLYSLNKPDIVLNTDIVINLVYILLLFLFSWLELGIYSVVILYSIYLIVKTGTLQYFANKGMHTHFVEYLALFGKTTLVTIIMSVVVIGVKLLVGTIGSLMMNLIVSSLIGAVTYGVILYLIDKKTVKDMIRLIKSRGV